MIKTINYKPICITILIVCTMNLLFNVFTGATVKREPRESTRMITAAHICDDLSHATCDGNCGCDGMGCFISGRNQAPVEGNHYTYTIERLDNGDIVVYDEDVTVGVVKYHPDCDFQKIFDSNED